ncbi:MAG: methyl-accepting chemotaxis protein, partial [Comamonadaceae bacterium]
MLKNITAATFLNTLIGMLLLGVAAFGAFGYYALQEANASNAAALQAGYELGKTAGAASAEEKLGVETAFFAQAGTLDSALSDRTLKIGIAMGVLVLLGVGAAVWLRSLIHRANQRPVNLATRLVKQVAAGDLTVKAEGMNQLHTRRLASALDEMSVSLRTLVGEVAESARTVADTSAQIAQGNLDLSQRTEEQAST